MHVDGQKDIEAVFVGRGNFANPSDIYFTAHDDTTIDGLFYETNDVVHFHSTKLGSDTQGSFANGSFTNGEWFGLPSIDGLHLQYEPPVMGADLEGQRPGTVGGIEIGPGRGEDEPVRPGFGVRVPLTGMTFGSTADVPERATGSGSKTLAVRDMRVKAAEVAPAAAPRQQAIDIVLRDEMEFAGAQLQDLFDELGTRQA